MEALNEASGIKAEENRLKTLLEQNNIKKAEFTQRVIKNKSDAAVFNETMEREKAVLDDVSEKIAKLNTTNQEIKQTIAELDSKKAYLFFLRYCIISLAVCTSSVTIFCMLPPSAVSTAISYSFCTFK